MLSRFRAVLLVAAGATSLAAQMPDDGVMMPRRMLSAGLVYAHDSWDQYWEGTLKRSNGNIGTLTTTSLTFVTGYGITDRLGVIATLPYVRTEASQGTLHGLEGVQDLSIALKYRVLTATTAEHGSVSAFVAGVAAIPMSDYTPDFMPLSIGSGGSRAAARATLNYQSPSSWFVNASGAYTFCMNVTLDRASYYTNGELYNTNEVAMPNVVDYSLSAGVKHGKWKVPVSVVRQRTLGGGDIRRQDMPFVSNRMDFTKVDGAVMYGLKDVTLRIGAARVLNGRNVGQSTTLSTGMFYAFQF